MPASNPIIGPDLPPAPLDQDVTRQVLTELHEMISCTPDDEPPKEVPNADR